MKPLQFPAPQCPAGSWQSPGWDGPQALCVHPHPAPGPALPICTQCSALRWCQGHQPPPEAWRGKSKPARAALRPRCTEASPCAQALVCLGPAELRGHGQSQALGLHFTAPIHSISRACHSIFVQVTITRVQLLQKEAKKGSKLSPDAFFLHLLFHQLLQCQQHGKKNQPGWGKQCKTNPASVPLQSQTLLGFTWLKPAQNQEVSNRVCIVLCMESPSLPWEGS